MQCASRFVRCPRVWSSVLRRHKATRPNNPSVLTLRSGGTDVSQPFVRFLESVELSLGFAKLPRVDAAPSCLPLVRVSQVQHLVVHHVLHYKPRYLWLIQNPADDDCMVCRIVMPQN